MQNNEVKWLGPESHWKVGWMNEVVHPDSPELPDRSAKFFAKIIVPCMQELGLDVEVDVSELGEQAALEQVYNAVQSVKVDSMFGQRVNWIHISTFAPHLHLFGEAKRELQRARILTWAALSALHFLQSTPTV